MKYKIKCIYIFADDGESKETRRSTISFIFKMDAGHQTS